jgi:hypothetical protein
MFIGAFPKLSPRTAEVGFVEMLVRGHAGDVSSHRLQREGGKRSKTFAMGGRRPREWAAVQVLCAGCGRPRRALRGWQAMCNRARSLRLRSNPRSCTGPRRRPVVGRPGGGRSARLHAPTSSPALAAPHSATDSAMTINQAAAIRM